MIKAIVCLSENNGIGLNGNLLFYLPKDLAYFKGVTLGETVLMGAETFRSLPMNPRGLPLRDNIVLTSKEGISLVEEGYTLVTGNKSLVEEYLIDSIRNEDPLWLIGGKSIYELYEHLVDEWFITRVKSSTEADTFFKPNLEGFTLRETKDVSSEELVATVEVWKRDK